MSATPKPLGVLAPPGTVGEIEEISIACTTPLASITNTWDKVLSVTKLLIFNGSAAPLSSVRRFGGSRPSAVFPRPTFPLFKIVIAFDRFAAFTPFPIAKSLSVGITAFAVPVGTYVVE